MGKEANGRYVHYNQVNLKWMTNHGEKEAGPTKCQAILVTDTMEALWKRFEDRRIA